MNPARSRIDDTGYGFEGAEQYFTVDQRLCHAVIVRAHRDYMYFWQCSDVSTAGLYDAHDAYLWVHRELTYSPKPFSFQWCAEAVYNSSAEGFIQQLRYAMRFPVPRTREARLNEPYLAMARAEVLKYQTQHCNRGKA